MLLSLSPRQSATLVVILQCSALLVRGQFHTDRVQLPSEQRCTTLVAGSWTNCPTLSTGNKVSNVSNDFHILPCDMANRIAKNRNPIGLAMLLIFECLNSVGAHSRSVHWSYINEHKWTMFRVRVHKHLPVLVCVEKFVADIVYSICICFCLRDKSVAFRICFSVVHGTRFQPFHRIRTWSAADFRHGPWLFMTILYMAVTAVSLQNVLCIRA